jgi:1,4-alpha-glucan branching enzyme
LSKSKQKIQSELILAARHHDPFAYLGLHPEDGTLVFRAFLPHAENASIQTAGGWQDLQRVHESGLYEFHAQTPEEHPLVPCLMRLQKGGSSWEQYDPYSFTATITGDELYLFGEGRLKESYTMLGAHLMTQQEVSGVRFAVWAPNAERVSVVGNFNNWDGRVHPMRAHGSSGVWELFIPGLQVGEIYKFEIRNRQTGNVLVKTDPYGFSFELRPGTAASVAARDRHVWQDQEWLQKRAKADWLRAPFNCYEVHLGSWHRNAEGGFLNYRELADRLIPYMQEMGYTHIELLPVSEHPLDESWGYQTTGYYAVTNRFGTPDDFRYFVDSFHQAGMGVILDWVPGHFPKDDWALARFDGTALFEHEDPRLGEHQDWGTYIFNYGRNEVRNFLLANAHYWLEEFHIDGLRVDAVASMIYLDYSRKHGEWLPNKYGGRENLEALDFMRQLNMMVHEDFPGAFTIAEESTAWPMVSRPVYVGGLGFSMKWNMGWMNDTLSYMQNDPINRRYHHDKLTFGQLYAYSENFVLPFSHDEVVHGKRSLLDKMPGDAWQKFANLRLLLAYQATTPGKKLNFMGNEFGHGREWNACASLDWHLLETHWHQGVRLASRDLNHLYKTLPALHELDFEQQGFGWIDCCDTQQSVISYTRHGRDGSFVVVILNFTPVLREGYRIGVPSAGTYRELFNSDAGVYGGSNKGNGSGLKSEATPWMGFAQSLLITLPPLAGLILQPRG